MESARLTQLRERAAALRDELKANVALALTVFAVTSWGGICVVHIEFVSRRDCDASLVVCSGK